MEELFVYPRLDPETSRLVLEDLAALSVTDLRERSLTTHPAASYYPTGTPVHEDRLLEVREAVREVVDSLGFPEAHGHRHRLINAFDQRLAGVLHQTMAIIPADAASEGVWSFLTLIVLPDAAVWRYPDRDPRRLTGHFRNAFRRLWWRAHVLGDGPADAPAVLQEDQLVAIMERPTIGGEPRVARALFKAFRTGQERHPAVPAMLFMRESAKRLLRFTAFLSVGSLPEGELDRLLEEVVESAAVALEHHRSDPAVDMPLSDTEEAEADPAQAVAPPSADRPGGTLMEIHVIYKGHRFEATFDRHTEEVVITSGVLAGETFGSPSGAAQAVVKAINPKRLAPHTNGWRFWVVTEGGKPLGSIRA